jgi:RNA polymerase sigma factor (TIGR02999 family)
MFHGQRRRLASVCEASVVESMRSKTSPGHRDSQELRPVDDNSAAAEQCRLFVTLYAELERRAAWQLRNLPPSNTLQPAALVHETYIKLQHAEGLHWNSPTHFFAIACKAMREVITDSLRRKLAGKRQGHYVDNEIAVTLIGRNEAEDVSIEDYLDLDHALTRLEKHHQHEAQVVLLRFFGGFTMDEIAVLQDISTRTAERRWRFARAWLKAEMKQQAR